jgi:Tfp pilus assembly protein FimV
MVSAPIATATTKTTPTVQSLEAQVAKLQKELNAANAQIAQLKGKPVTPPTTQPGVQSNSSDKTNPPAADVVISSCTVDPTTGWPAAALTITNHSSKPSDYIIQVGFFDSTGARVAEGDDLENNVPSQGVVKDTAQGFATVTGTVTCKLVSVDRTASS